MNQMILGDQPKQIKCPYCSTSTVTAVQFKNGYISYTICTFTLLLLGLLPSILIIPAVLLLTKSLVHRCSVCNQEIGGDGNVFHALRIKESMISFKLGELGCILTKSIVIGIAFIALTIALFWYRVSTLPHHTWENYHHHAQADIKINDTWTDFLESCSRDQIISSITAYQGCSNKYIERTVQDWSGYAIRVEDNQKSLLKFLHHSVNILVRMDPAESDQYPDILLTADSEMAAQLSSEIELLNRGSRFQFSAVIKSIGDTQNLRHFHLISIQRLEGFIEIAPHLHSRGRYGESETFLEGK